MSDSGHTIGESNPHHPNYQGDLPPRVAPVTDLEQAFRTILATCQDMARREKEALARAQEFAAIAREAMALLANVRQDVQAAFERLDAITRKDASP